MACELLGTAWVEAVRRRTQSGTVRETAGGRRGWTEGGARRASVRCQLMRCCEPQGLLHPTAMKVARKCRSAARHTLCYECVAGSYETPCHLTLPPPLPCPVAVLLLDDEEGERAVSYALYQNTGASQKETRPQYLEVGCWEVGCWEVGRWVLLAAAVGWWPLVLPLCCIRCAAALDLPVGVN